MQGFFGGGGFPAGFEEAFGGGGGRGGGGRSREPVDTEQYYKDLGIAKGASSGEGDCRQPDGFHSLPNFAS